MTDKTDLSAAANPEAHAHAGDERERIKGVFSSQEVRKVGTGTTTRKTIQKAYWFVEENDDGSLMVQPLNANYIPSGPKRTVPLDEFLERFAPEPEFYMQTVFPKMREVNKTIARADRHRKRGENFSAEFEYSNALAVDEENVRANFGLGLTYLERGDNSKANDIFERLVKLEAAFEEEHKHLFNEFGINLRKNKMLDQSLEYYQRAMELSKKDENLFYNIARVYLEKKDFEKTVACLLTTLELNPGLEAGLKFLQWMKDKNLVTPDQAEAVDAALAKAQGSPPAADA